MSDKKRNQRQRVKKSASAKTTADAPAGAANNGVSDETVERWLEFLGPSTTATTEGTRATDKNPPK